MSLAVKKKKNERLSIDVKPEEHRKIKAMAALQGKTIREYVLECVWKEMQADDELEQMTTMPTAVLEEIWDNEKDSYYDQL
ncbi:hypothetical protein KAJ27_00120 [bacterium]|nr:hypothetical protein [bacterium]